MKDRGEIPAGLSPADAAVACVLRRVIYDGNVRHFISEGTESFERLVLAHCARTGEERKEVIERIRATKTDNEREFQRVEDCESCGAELFCPSCSYNPFADREAQVAADNKVVSHLRGLALDLDHMPSMSPRQVLELAIARIERGEHR